MAMIVTPMAVIGSRELLVVVGRLVPPTLPAGLTSIVTGIECTNDPLSLVPITLNVPVPTGVENAAFMVSMLVNGAKPVCGLGEHVAPAGRPLHDKTTCCEEPLVRVTVMVVEPSPP